MPSARHTSVAACAFVRIRPASPRADASAWSSRTTCWPTATMHPTTQPASATSSPTSAKSARHNPSASTASRSTPVDGSRSHATSAAPRRCSRPHAACTAASASSSPPTCAAPTTRPTSKTWCAASPTILDTHRFTSATAASSYAPAHHVAGFLRSSSHGPAFWKSLLSDLPEQRPAILPRLREAPCVRRTSVPSGRRARLRPPARLLRSNSSPLFSLEANSHNPPTSTKVLPATATSSTAHSTGASPESPVLAEAARSVTSVIGAHTPRHFMLLGKLYMAPISALFNSGASERGPLLRVQRLRRHARPVGERHRHRPPRLDRNYHLERLRRRHIRQSNRGSDCRCLHHQHERFPQPPRRHAASCLLHLLVQDRPPTAYPSTTMFYWAYRTQLIDASTFTTITRNTGR